MTLKEHYIISENKVITVEKARKVPVKYVRKEGTGEKTRYFYREDFPKPSEEKVEENKGAKKRSLTFEDKNEATKKVKVLFNKFKEFADKVKELEEEEENLKGYKKEIQSEVEPLFREFEANSIKIQGLKDSIALKLIDRISPSWKDRFAAAYDLLTDEGKKKIDAVKDTMVSVVSYLQEEKPGGVEKAMSDNPISKLKQELKDLITIQKKFVKLLKEATEGKIQKGYAEIKKWKDKQQSEWPVEDKDIASEPEEDLEKTFVSQAQRGWMYENKPEMAREFESKTPKGKKLPYHVAKKKSIFIKVK